ncbi:MAG: 4Fe-4S ferredoxin [Candidatus Thorarchaeota archaeon]|nr:MAG: 4Fe-4S ferredoxin [Candidatus Thorarchaeota archaeon]
MILIEASGDKSDDISKECMGSPYWFVQIVLKTFRQVINIAKLTNAPLIGRVIDYALFEGDDITYLPKDIVIPINKEIGAPESRVVPSQILENFLDRAENIFLMDFCPCRTSMKCESHSRDLGCIFMGKAAADINPELGRLVSAKAAKEHLRRCREEGLVHMIGRQKLDAVWLNVGPIENLLSICNCCSCCCLWRVIPHIHPNISKKIKRLEGVKVEVSEDCIGCRTCIDAGCFADAIRMVNGKAMITEECRGCGRCVELCPEEAIDLSFENPDILDKIISKITKLVNVE